MVGGGFSWARTPRIIFGAGRRAQLGETVAALGRSALVVTGARALQQSGRLADVREALAACGVRVRKYSVAGEPAPELVDRIVAELRGDAPDVVVALGGGSVMDAGKAISAMLPQTESVEAFLEGVGGQSHDGRKVPFVAVPTTAGTGSEATKNAVLSRVGPDGFKASLRHDNLVPDVALIDPELALTCPAEVTAACGMDALTQLLEAYVSTKASPLTDALAWSGLSAVRDHLLAAYREGATNVAARTGMAYGALLSGMALANAGLGVVHGLAGVIGGLRPMPHGAACGTLLAAATRMNVARLKQTGGVGLRKYAAVGRLFEAKADDAGACCDHLVAVLTRWMDELALPRLSCFDISGALLEHIAARASNKNNPVELDAADRQALLAERV